LLEFAYGMEELLLDFRAEVKGEEYIEVKDLIKLGKLMERQLNELVVKDLLQNEGDEGDDGLPIDSYINIANQMMCHAYHFIKKDN